MERNQHAVTHKEFNTQRLGKSVKNRCSIANRPDPFFMQALILQAITPCLSKSDLDTKAQIDVSYLLG